MGPTAEEYEAQYELEDARADLARIELEEAQRSRGKQLTKHQK